MKNRIQLLKNSDYVTGYLDGQKAAKKIFAFIYLLTLIFLYGFLLLTN